MYKRSRNYCFSSMFLLINYNYVRGAHKTELSKIENIPFRRNQYLEDISERFHERYLYKSSAAIKYSGYKCFLERDNIYKKKMQLTYAYVENDRSK